MLLLENSKANKYSNIATVGFNDRKQCATNRTLDRATNLNLTGLSYCFNMLFLHGIVPCVGNEPFP